MRSKPMILVALLLAAFLVNLDTTLVNVALPAMVRELHATTTQLQWVVDAYNLVFAALLLTFGSLSDRFGRKGMLLAGLAVVGGASLAGGFTTTPGQLIAARAVMGLGAAMTFPATLSLISNVFTERRERARAIGLWGAIAGVAIATGPIVGGWLLEHYNWTSIFVAMVPVAAVAAILVAGPPTAAAAGWPPRRARCRSSASHSRPRHRLMGRCGSDRLVSSILEPSGEVLNDDAQILGDLRAPQVMQVIEHDDERILNRRPRGQ
jgi:MFS family permease